MCGAAGARPSWCWWWGFSHEMITGIPKGRVLLAQVGKVHVQVVGGAVMLLILGHQHLQSIHQSTILLTSV